MKQELYLKSYQVDTIADMPETSYENIFNMFTDDNFLAYNILRTVNIPQDIDTDLFYYTQITGQQPWTRISLDHYGTIRLWWLICITNKIMNPVVLPAPGTLIKVIKQEYISDILEQIKIRS